MEVKFMTLDELKEFIDGLVKTEKEDDKVAEAKYDKAIHAMFELVKVLSGDGNFAKDATAFEDCLHKRSLRDKRTFFINMVDECDGLVNTIMELTAEYAVCHRLKEKVEVKVNKEEK